MLAVEEVDEVVLAVDEVVVLCVLVVDEVELQLEVVVL